MLDLTSLTCCLMDPVGMHASGFTPCLNYSYPLQKLKRDLVRIPHRGTRLAPVGPVVVDDVEDDLVADIDNYRACPHFTRPSLMGPAGMHASGFAPCLDYSYLPQKLKRDLTRIPCRGH
jgi:hypothetical protein